MVSIEAKKVLQNNFPFQYNILKVKYGYITYFFHGFNADVFKIDTKSTSKPTT